MNKYLQPNIRLGGAAFFALSLVFVLFINGAIPFVSMPTLGQALSSIGYSQSFANESIFTIHATSFGYPTPAAKSFGLAGSYPASFFIRLGVNPADAYTLISTIWFSIAFIGAYRIARSFNLSEIFSSLLSILWLSMPIVWNHAGYSWLSMGIGLLPFYFFVALRLFQYMVNSKEITSQMSALYLSSTIIAVFMDGYSFMMFAVGSSILGAYSFLRLPEHRKTLLTVSFPIHILSFVAAYLLYVFYIGKSQFDPSPLSFFRGWGVDLMFLAVPSKGVHWVWDSLGLSVQRTGREQFGDASVWITTFALPIIVAGIFAWWQARKTSKLATGFLLLALFGFYMGMGPSIKLDSIKPKGVQGSLMAEKYAVAATGSALLSSNVTGFKSMRASYRWTALGFFGFWLIIVLLLSQEQSTRLKWLVTFAVILLIISNLPHIGKKLSTDINYRDDAFDIDKTLVEDLKNDVLPGELIAFLPYRNDVFVNYLAPRVNFITYNIGGDKNLMEARKNWPETMAQFKWGNVDEYFSQRALMLLARGEANAIVLPYIDLLWAAHSWPAKLKYKDEMKLILTEMRASNYVEIDERRYYAIVRLLEKFKDTTQLNQLEQTLFNDYCMPPNCLQYQGDKKTPSQVGQYIVGRGMQTDGRAGYLIYGPYQAMKAGKYILQIKGKVKVNGDHAAVDVVYHKEGKTYAKFNGLSTNKALANNILLEEKIILNDVDQLEIRVQVGESTDLIISEYSLKPIITNNTKGAE
ncbi:MAG: hypothetical protein AB9Q23_12790 [Candidatus Reddybacter sp.]